MSPYLVVSLGSAVSKAPKPKAKTAASIVLAVYRTQWALMARNGNRNTKKSPTISSYSATNAVTTTKKLPSLLIAIIASTWVVIAKSDGNLSAVCNEPAATAVRHAGD